MRRNYSRIKECPAADPADVDKGFRAEIAGMSYKLPADRINDFLDAVLGLESVPEELRNLSPGETFSMPINGDSISIRRTLDATCDRIQFFPDNPDRKKYTPKEIRTMKNLDLRARAYFDRCHLLPSAIYEGIFRPS